MHSKATQNIDLNRLFLGCPTSCKRLSQSTDELVNGRGGDGRIGHVKGRDDLTYISI